MLPIVSSTTLDAIRSTTTLVSGSCPYACLSCHDRLNPGTVFDMLKPYTAFNAAYNSGERESEHATTCLEDTRKDVINKISAWVEGNHNRPVCWLEGPAGSGKSTIAHTIAERCANNQQLAFTFFFSRGKLDRNDTSKFFPTFAYQLASSVPAVRLSMQHALENDSSIPFQRLGDQMKKLIVDPILTITGPITSLIVVIDGLDECGGDTGLLQGLIRLLVDASTAHRLPFRFLFASRPEPHIQQTFESSPIQGKTYGLALGDFNARDDVREFLRSHLSQIREAQKDLMRNVPRPWPSQRDLEVVVNQSEGLFIYVSTLVKFVADRNGLPHHKLQVTMGAHTGVDPLYNQVLSEAQQFDHFERVVGAIMFLRPHPILTVHALEQFLQLQSGGVRLALRGCQSILVIPNQDEDGTIQPYHASLRDFLTDHNRAGNHFLDAMKHHISILVDCLNCITADTENNTGGGKHVDYAWQNWCHHFSLVLLHGRDNGHIESSLRDWLAAVIMKMQQCWLKLWFYRFGDFGTLKAVNKDCCLALAKLTVGLLLGNNVVFIDSHYYRSHLNGKLW